MASEYAGDDDDAWDFDLLDDILRKAEAANAAKRASQAAVPAFPSSVASAPPQAETCGTSNFTSQVYHSNSVQYGMGGPDSGYRQGDARPGAPQMGRGWQHSPTPVRTPVDTVRSTGYHVSQPAGPRSGMGSLQQNLPDRVAGGVTSPQPSSVGTMHNRANHNYGNLTNSPPTRHTGHENMPPPGPSPLGRQPLSQAPSGGTLNLTSPEGDDEKRKLREELAEKTGAVSLLKSRLSQADKELFELKTRPGRQSNGHTGPDQARELNRLTSDLLFKDQELLEAKRAKSYKEEQLKEALASAAALKEEVEALKRDKHKRVMDRNGSGQNRGSSTAQELCRHEQQDDIVMERKGVRPEGIIVQPEHCSSPLLPTKDVHASHKQANAAIANKQASDHAGGVSVKGKEKVDHDTQEGVHPRPSDSEIQRLMDMKHSIEHIWGLRGLKDDGVDIVTKLHAACPKEMYTLLNVTSSEQEGKQQKDARPVVNPSSNNSRKRKGTEVEEHAEPRESSSLMLHNAISEVANRHASPSALLGPLLSFCNIRNVDLIFCALHILRHVLTHDSSCRGAILGRNSVCDVSSAREMEPHSSGSCDPLEAPKTIGREGWSIMRSKSMASNGIETPVFSSPRIICRVKEVGSTSGENQISATEQVDMVPQEATNTSKKRNSLGDDEILSKKNSFTAWALDVGSQSTSSGVQAEAATIVYLLVAHSEPRTERIQFAFMLFDGRLAGLVRQAASPEIMQSAVNIVQLLLSCSDIYNKFCTSVSRDQAQNIEAGGKRDLPAVEDMQIDGGADDKVEGGLENHTTEPVTSKVDSVLDVVNALSSCLTYTGKTLKEYALRRRAVRVLNFLAVSGELGAATLIRRPAGSDTFSEAGKQDTGGTERKKSETAANSPSTSKRLSENSGGSGAIENTPAATECSSVALQLMSLIDAELDAQEYEEGSPDSDLDAEEEERSPTSSKPDAAAERMNLLSDALSLLCRLSAHGSISSSILSSLTVTKQTLRLSVSVTNRLISRAYSPHVYRSSELKSRYSSMVEQAEVLKKRILSILPQPEGPQSSEKNSLEAP